MSPEKFPQSKDLELPPSNLEPVEGDAESEVSPETRELAENVTDMAVAEEVMADEAVFDISENDGISETEPSVPKQGFLTRIQTKAKGFVAASIAAGALVGFQGTFNDAEAASRSRTSRIIQRTVQTGREIYRDVERENLRRNRRELAETRRDISRLEGEIKRIDRMIEKTPEQGERTEQRSLGTSESYLQKAERFRIKAEKAKSIDPKLAESYMRLADRYQAEADAKMKVEVDSSASIEALRQKKEAITSELVELRKLADEIQSKIDSSRMRERVIRNIPSRF